METERIQKFWEWCGFEWVKVYGIVIFIPTARRMWKYPNGQRYSQLPPITLDNLFKYAVPKLPKFETGDGIDIMISLDLLDDGSFDCEIECKQQAVSAQGKDPATALFLAIEKIIGGVNENWVVGD